MNYIARVMITKEEADLLLPQFGFTDIGQGQWVTQQEEPCSTAEALNNVLFVIYQNEIERISKPNKH